MADSRTLQLTIRWEDDGEEDYDADGNESGYLKFMNTLQDLGVEIVDEITV